MHILSDEQYNRLMAMKAYLEDPAPLPMRDEEDTDLRDAVKSARVPAEADKRIDRRGIIGGNCRRDGKKEKRNAVE